MELKNDGDVKKIETKGILLTNNKILSKNRRISWGEVKIKEFETNIELADNKTIEEVDSSVSKNEYNYLEEEKFLKKKENIK